MVRFWDLATHAGQATALNAWLRFAQSHPWYLIQSTLRCARTFARDELEALYVDHMHHIVQGVCVE